MMAASYLRRMVLSTLPSARPTRDITTKINGTNSFEFLPLVDGYCPVDATDPASPLDPGKTDCPPFARRAPFSQCKNNCPRSSSICHYGRRCYSCKKRWRESEMNKV
eukprot:TRINITY_DN8626_c0_g1_i1.p1 TRINITY_DN8626_c0_g1~~TRINITY_DN8626_c0_g1_i1.p1  ORF type:complete len:107 (-),score=11.81 TRINITY_DN8626_c0_g1_i1:46-366(-)